MQEYGLAKSSRSTRSCDDSKRTTTSCKKSRQRPKAERTYLYSMDNRFYSDFARAIAEFYATMEEDNLSSFATSAVLQTRWSIYLVSVRSSKPFDYNTTVFGTLWAMMKPKLWRRYASSRMPAYIHTYKLPSPTARRPRTSTPMSITTMASCHL